MARLTVLPKLALVGVVRRMAGVARRRELILVEIATMAALALQARVRSPQGEIRRLGMIERHFFPLRRRVATLALPAVSPGMNVLDRMARDAFARQILIAFTDVASRALNPLMRALQRESRLGVIERSLGPPGGLVVARPAILTELTIVLVVPSMAREAR